VASVYRCTKDNSTSVEEMAVTSRLVRCRIFCDKSTGRIINKHRFILIIYRYFKQKFYNVLFY